MKRRSFLLGALLGLLGLGIIPVIQWVRHFSVKDSALAQPKLLSMLCDSKTILMLGRAYLKMKPQESRGGRLLVDLLGDKFSKIPENQDMPAVESQLEKRIKQDFENSNTVVLKGWVLSVTEARQCAFFSILNA
jgi:hypothetical protein